MIYIDLWEESWIIHDHLRFLGISLNDFPGDKNLARTANLPGDHPENSHEELSSGY